MLLLVGLGNPGAKYAGHRHNIGFVAVDEIARQQGFSTPRKRFSSETAEGVIAGEKCILVKPHTFMNDSGQAVGECMRYFKATPDDVTVIHDEIDLAPAKIRVKTGGGVAGHNGLRSIARHIGPDFRRIRIGVGHPGDKDRVHGYVLRDFNSSERGWVEDMTRAIGEFIPLVIEGSSSTFLNRVHLAVHGPDEPAENNNGE